MTADATAGHTGCAWPSHSSCTVLRVPAVVPFVTPPHSRRAVLAAAGVAVSGLTLAGCLGSDTGDGPAGDASDATADTGRAGQSEGPTSPRGTGVTSGASTTAAASVDALPTRDDPLPVHYTFAHIRDRTTPGGPPKDGIPSIDDPAFESAAAASEWLDPGDVVFGVARGNDVRAYPQRILVHHEIANDTVDGENVSVTYCPLTGTAMGFFRGETTFGVSGDLVNSNLVMYDRATDSRWPQVMATAVSGPFRGQSLTEFPVTWTSFERWRAVHPDTVVLSRDTGFVRNYNNDPYGAYNPPRGYYVNTHTLFPPLTRDGPVTYNPKRVVVGVREPGGAVVGFLESAVRERGVLTGVSNGTEVVAVYDPSLDTVRTYRNPERRSVEPAPDSEAGSGTDAGGVVVDGEPVAVDELPLEPVLGFDAMWFAWTRIYPESVIVTR